MLCLKSLAKGNAASKEAFVLGRVAPASHKSMPIRDRHVVRRFADEQRTRRAPSTRQRHSYRLLALVRSKRTVVLELLAIGGHHQARAGSE